MRRYFLRTLAALTLIFSLASQASARQIASPAPTAPPSYAKASTEQTIRGRIAAIKDPFHLSIRDAKGAIADIRLHKGTIITPVGLTLAVGMKATIIGDALGTFLDANEIDTPYTYAGPPPPAYYYGAGWWYPGFPYGYGPAFGLFVDAKRSVVHRGKFPHQSPAVPAPAPPKRRNEHAIPARPH